jgi:glucokinase
MHNQDKIILSLDAGGTNLVFTAIEGGELSKKYSIPTVSKTLNDFLEKLILGFDEVLKSVGGKADAISFCFPGPADYKAGIIGDLENLPFFKGGVPLRQILENEFKIPVFINNDGDLFTLGEAVSGLLPKVNSKLKENGNRPGYRNILGVTLGTGFGGGLASRGKLWLGDNSAGVEINRFLNPFDHSQSAEEILSIRGIKKLFADFAGCMPENTPQPIDIFRIGMGRRKGNKEAAIKAWDYFGKVLGEVLANAASLTDSLIVVGGGLSAAYPLFLQTAVNTMNGQLKKAHGGKMPRMEVFAYNLNNQQCLADFLMDESKEIIVPFSGKKIKYNAIKKIGLGISVLGTSEAVAIGAWEVAVGNLPTKENALRP